MRVFHFRTIKSKQDIKDALSSFLETEYHSPWRFFENYDITSYIDPHLYISKNKIHGYYENGKTTRTRYSREFVKNWVYIYFYSKNGITYIFGIIFFEPLVPILMFLAVWKCWHSFLNSPLEQPGFLGAMIPIILVPIFLVDICVDQKKFYEMIYNQIKFLF